MVYNTDENRFTSFTNAAQAPDRGYYLDLLPAAVGAGVVGLVITSTLAALLEPLPKLVELWLAVVPLHVAAFGTVILGLGRLAPPGKRLDSLELRPPAHARSWFNLLLGALVITACFYPVNLLIAAYSVAILKQFGLPVLGSPVLDVLAGDHAVLAAVSVGLVSIVIAPIAEEVMFRLVLFESLQRLRVPAASGVTALIFAFLHGLPAQLPGLFLFGLLLQQARRRTGSLILPIAIHMLFNGTSVLITLLYFPGS